MKDRTFYSIVYSTLIDKFKLVRLRMFMQIGILIYKIRYGT